MSQSSFIFTENCLITFPDTVLELLSLGCSRFALGFPGSLWGDWADYTGRCVCPLGGMLPLLVGFVCCQCTLGAGRWIECVLLLLSTTD